MNFSLCFVSQNHQLKKDQKEEALENIKEAIKGCLEARNTILI